MTEVIKVEDCGENIGDYDVPIYKAILIPKNATNGDVIKAMFFDTIFTDSMVEGYVCNIESHLIGRNTKRMYFNVEWWNAPYKVESEETDADSD